MKIKMIAILGFIGFFVWVTSGETADLLQKEMSLAALSDKSDLDKLSKEQAEKSKKKKDIIIVDHDKPSKAQGYEDVFSSDNDRGRYVVDSSEFNESDSLNRIAGEIDSGYTQSISTYKSPNHYRAGPMNHEKAMLEREASK